MSRKSNEPPSPHYEGNNKGGYANPPIDHQFQEGNPGGPGRPRGVSTLESAMTKMMRSKVTVTKGGESMKISMMDALAERAKKEMLSGPYKSFALGIELSAKYGPKEVEEEVNFSYLFGHWSYEKKLAYRDFLRALTKEDREEYLTAEANIKAKEAERAEKDKKRREAARARRRARRNGQG